MLYRRSDDRDAILYIHVNVVHYITAPNMTASSRRSIESAKDLFELPYRDLISCKPMQGRAATEVVWAGNPNQLLQHVNLDPSLAYSLLVISSERCKTLLHFT